MRGGDNLSVDFCARDEATIHEGYCRAAPGAPEWPSRDRNGRAGRHARAVMAAQESCAKGPSQRRFARARGGPLREQDFHGGSHILALQLPWGHLLAP